MKGQAKVEIIISNPVVLKSSPLLPLSNQRKIDAVDKKDSKSRLFLMLSKLMAVKLNNDQKPRPDSRYNSPKHGLEYSRTF